MMWLRLTIILALCVLAQPTTAQSKNECPGIELSGQLLKSEIGGTRLYCDFGDTYSLKTLCPTLNNRILIKARMHAKSLRCVYLSTWEYLR